MNFTSIPDVLNEICSFANKYEKYFTNDEMDYIEAYCGFVLRMYNKGVFNDPDALEKMKWCKYNIRYGIKSVVGVLGEVISVGILNESASVNGTEYRLVPEDKNTQVSGIDIEVRNTKWKKPFTAQVKTSKKNLNTLLEGAKANRLILVDFSKGVVSMFDLPAFKKYVEKNGDDLSKLLLFPPRSLRASYHSFK